jgi:hypothetical protein
MKPSLLLEMSMTQNVKYTIDPDIFKGIKPGYKSAGLAFTG